MSYVYDIIVRDEKRDLGIYRINGWESKNPITTGEELVIIDETTADSNHRNVGIVAKVVHYSYPTTKPESTGTPRETTSQTLLFLNHPGPLVKTYTPAGVRDCLEQALKYAYGSNLIILDKSH